MTILYFDEPEDIKTLIEAGLVVEGLTGFFYLFTREPTLRNEFPYVQITKEGSTPDEFIGNEMPEGGKGNIQTCTIKIEIATRKGYIKVFETRKYENDKLTNLIKTIIQTIMFKNRQWMKDAQSNILITNYMANELPADAFVRINSPFFTKTIYYHVEYSYKYP